MTMHPSPADPAAPTREVAVISGTAWIGLITVVVATLPILGLGLVGR